MIRLTLGSRDAATFRLLFALEELGLPYELTPIDLMALGQWNADHRILSSTGAVPVLEIAGSVLQASDLALLRLAEGSPEKALTFADARLAYDCLHVIGQLDDLLETTGNLLGWIADTDAAARQDYMARLAATPGRPIVSGWTAVIRDAIPPGERPAAAREKISEGLDLIEQLLGDGEWLIGGRFSVADIAAYSLIYQMGAFLQAGERPQNRPPLAAWMERTAARPACTSALQRLDAERITMRFSPPVDHE